MKLQPDHPIFIYEPLVFAGFAFKEPLCLFRQAEGVSMPVKRREFVRDAFEERNFGFFILNCRYRKPPDLLIVIFKYLSLQDIGKQLASKADPKYCLSSCNGFFEKGFFIPQTGVFFRSLKFFIGNRLNWIFRCFHIIPGALHLNITVNTHPGRITPNGKSST